MRTDARCNRHGRGSTILAEPSRAEASGAGPARVPDARWVFSSPAAFIAFGAGSGLAQRGPGTAGTLAAVPLHLLLAWALPSIAHLGAIMLLFVLGVWACAAAARDLGSDDPGGIVIDEVVAFLLVLWWVPATVPAWIAAFALFRLFDIWKPQPIRWFDRNLKGGFGVMFDDLLAAVATLIVFAIPAIVGT
ncbi:MAG: phosphatidylglycerophosphatase A [Burkholderiales bacterium]|nr:phosphatidylglycerophosphatase A [Burkholderiales bacterium]